MNLKLLSTILFIGLLTGLQAQIRYGFKTGLNFVSIEGPTAADPAGASIENWDNVTGFHIGMTLAHSFSHNFGARAELLYSKKGGKYTFESNTPDASYKFFKTSSGNVLTKSDKVRYLINTNNSYFDIPVMLYGRWRDFEVSAGAGIGILVASTGDGSLNYTGRTQPPQNVSTGDLQFNLNYNYLRDGPGESTEGSENVSVKLNTQTIEVPKTIGAYFDSPDDKGNLYNSLDFSALVGLQYYISRALYLGGRLQYGLSDVTNNKVDVSRTTLDAQNNPVLSDDFDRNFNVQVSVGFSF